MLVPPYHLASNGAVEQAVQTVKRKLEKAGPGDTRAQLARLLLTYRSTPHEVTGCSPSELVLRRKMKTAIDLFRPDLRTTVQQKQLKRIRCDQGTKPQIQKHPGDQVFVRIFRSGPAWMLAVVTARCTFSSDLPLADGRRWMRHHDHLQPAKLLPHIEQNQSSGPAADLNLHIPSPVPDVSNIPLNHQVLLLVLLKSFS